MCVYYFRNLFKVDLLPKGAKIVGYARSALTVAELRSRVEPFLKVSVCVCVCVCAHNFKLGLSVNQ